MKQEFVLFFQMNENVPKKIVKLDLWRTTIVFFNVYKIIYSKDPCTPNSFFFHCCMLAKMSLWLDLSLTVLSIVCSSWSKSKGRNVKRSLQALLWRRNTNNYTELRPFTQLTWPATRLRNSPISDKLTNKWLCISEAELRYVGLILWNMDF